MILRVSPGKRGMGAASVPRRPVGFPAVFEPDVATVHVAGAKGGRAKNL